MRTPTVFTLAVACVVTAGCKTVNGRVADPSCPPQSTLVFFDRSVSADVAGRVPELADSLASIVERRLRCPGSELWAFFLHQSTMGGALHEHIDIEFQESSAQDRNELDSRRFAARAAAELASLQNDARDTLAAFASRTHDDLRPDWTDVLGSLYVAQKYLPKRDGRGPVELYYFSDMHESMPGSRRDFDRVLPRDHEQARHWAQEDREVMERELLVTDSTLRGVSVHVFSTPWRGTGRPELVETYWREIFQHAGARSEDIHYY